MVTEIEYLLTLREGGPKGKSRRYSMSDLQKSVGEILHQLCEWKKLEVLEMNVQEDYVHVVLSIPPKFSVSEVVGF